MTAAWRVFRYEFLRTLVKKTFQFFTFGVPILAVVAYFVITTLSAASNNNNNGSGGSNQPPTIAEDSPLRSILPVGYVDLSGLMADTPSPETTLRLFDSVQAASDAMMNGAISGYYVIAADYLKTGQIDFYFDRFNFGNLETGAIQRALVQALTRGIGTEVDTKVLARLQQRTLPANNNAMDEGTGNVEATSEDVSMLLIYAFAFFLLFTTFSTSGYLMQSVVEEKENRMVEVLLSSMRPRDLLAGKFLAYSLLGLLQAIAWGAALLFILGRVASTVQGLGGLQVTPHQMFVLALYYVLGYLLMAAAYATIGAISSNMREGPQVAVFITLPAAIPFYFMPVFITAPSGPMAVILSMFPLTAPLTMVARVAIIEIPAGELLLSVAFMLLGIAFFVWAAGRLFRVNVLLSGQMPRLRDIPKLLRESA